MARNGGGDATNWDEEGYRSSILLDRELRSRTVFRTAFAPSSNPNPETLAVASSDGSLAAYSISSCIAASHQSVHSRKRRGQELGSEFPLAEPRCIIQGHKGPAYDLKFYGNGDESLLLRSSLAKWLGRIVIEACYLLLSDLIFRVVTVFL